MRPDVVVEEAEFFERSVQCVERLDAELIEFAFQGAEETLHTPVLPGAMKISSLVADAEQKEGEAKYFGREDRFIVGPDDARLAVAPDRLDEFQDQGPRAFALKRFEPERPAAGVFQDRKNQTRAAIERRFARQIEPPDEVARHGLGLGALDLPAYDVDFVAMCSDDLRDEGLADGHLSPPGKAATEAVGNLAAAGMRHQGFQANSLPLDPRRFGRRADEDVVCGCGASVAGWTPVESEAQSEGN